jgi:ubiquinone biosynthesis protein UbiJ
MKMDDFEFWLKKNEFSHWDMAKVIEEIRNLRYDYNQLKLRIERLEKKEVY